METALGRGGYVTFGTQAEAENYLVALPFAYEGNTLKTESGKWAVSYRFDSTAARIAHAA